MFQTALNRMKDRQTEIAEFAVRMNQLAQRLEDETRALDRMESFSEITAWLKRTGEDLEEQADRVKDLGSALESAIRVYLSCEEEILDRLENGENSLEDGMLTYTEPEAPGIWAEIMEF